VIGGHTEAADQDRREEQRIGGYEAGEGDAAAGEGGPPGKHPGGGDPIRVGAQHRLDPVEPRVAAVQRTLVALDGATPGLEGVRPAADATTAVGPRRYLHGGPPLEAEELLGPMRGAIAGALVFEDQEADIEEAVAMLERGEIELAPAHDAGGVGAMAGIVSPIVTAMAGNGRRLGVRVSGAGECWFTAPAPLGEARLFRGYDASQARRHPAG
jgi:hypothetical protein